MKPTSYQQTRKNISTELQELQQKININEQLAIDAKIDTAVKTIEKLQIEVLRLEEQIDYFRLVSGWVESCITSARTRPTPNALKSIMSSSMRLTTLENEAIMFKTAKKTPKSSIASESNGKNVCSVSAHLRYVLADRSSNKNKIQQLINTRDALYTKIKDSLIKQEPYLYEKMMKKIQREVKREMKLQAIRWLQGQCQVKQKWLKETKQQVMQQADEKLIEQKISSNLMRMKQIMGKKINNDEYILSMANNRNFVEKTVQKLEKTVKQINNLFVGEIAKIENHHLQKQLLEIDQLKVGKQNIDEFDRECVDSLNQLIKEGERVLNEPLGSLETERLIKECERLHNEINYLSKKKI